MLEKINNPDKLNEDVELDRASPQLKEIYRANSYQGTFGYQY